MATWAGRIRDWMLRRNVLISRPAGQFHIEWHRLRQAKARGLDVRFALDGGAASGKWARELKAIYPAAQVLCVEPRDSVQAELRALADELPGIHLAKTLLGAAEGVAEFNVFDDMSSVLPSAAGTSFGRVVTEPVATIDGLLGRLSLGKPDLIKLDLQGAELQALDGAAGALRDARAVTLEVSFIPLQRGCPLIGDVLPYMSARGFRCYDLLTLSHRPLDGALAQCDLLFLRPEDPLLADPRWSADSPWS